MQYKLNNKLALLAGLAALAAAASAQVDPPDWWGTNDGFTTSQCFGFDQPGTPFEPEWFVNPFGTPSGWISEGDPEHLADFEGRFGVYCLNDDGGPNSDFDELTLDIPNLENIDFYKDWWLQMDVFFGVDSTLALRVSPNDVTNPPDFRDLGGGWVEITVTGQIWPQPPVEWVELWVPQGEVYIDSVYFGTHCSPVPEPASIAALGIGAVALIRRRKRK